MKRKHLAAAALAAVVAVAGVGFAGPADAHPGYTKPTFVNVDASVDHNGDLDITFKEFGLKSGQKTKVVGYAEAKALYAVSTDTGVVVVKVKDDVESDPFKRYAGWAYKHPFVKGSVELPHPTLADEAVQGTLIKVVFKDMVLKDKKTGACLKLDGKVSEKFNVVDEPEPPKDEKPAEDSTS